ncbi:hypothetical protein MSG28_009964 [Choristoneura fumiferana]|uniref:Uncharacterized protein n=1 Tax=Choristoneura fumiferana TaxID=7141 RepID=A0ACC0JDC8_CHOFU|nr:hypothetical protein MSG28_009964 [Choristoneura fumiferana]
MNTLLTSDDKVQAVKILSDGCRILSDLHFVETLPGHVKLIVFRTSTRQQGNWSGPSSLPIVEQGGAHLDLPDNDAIPYPYRRSPSQRSQRRQRAQRNGVGKIMSRPIMGGWSPIISIAVSVR